MTGILNTKQHDIQKMDLKIPFLVYVINNYQNNVGFELQTHFCVNESILNNGKSIHKHTTKNAKQFAYLAFDSFKIF